MSSNLLNAVLCQGAAECANLFSICIRLQHLANAIINAGFVMIQSARVGVGHFAEGVRVRELSYLAMPDGVDSAIAADDANSHGEMRRTRPQSSGTYI